MGRGTSGDQWRLLAVVVARVLVADCLDGAGTVGRTDSCSVAVVAVDTDKGLAGASLDIGQDDVLGAAAVGLAVAA